MNRPNQLPVERNLNLIYICSLVIAALVVVASVGGFLLSDQVYPADGVRTWVINDGVNLVIGLSFLLVSMGLARQGRLVGLLSWPGALFSILYIYVVYMIAVPFGVLFVVHVALVALSASTLIALVAAIDHQVVQQRVAGQVPARTGGGILVVLGIFIVLRQLGMIIQALAGPAAVPAAEVALWIDDLVVACPALIVVGVQLWRRQPLGHVGGAGLLLAYGLLSLGLVPVLALSDPPDIAGVVVILVMALVCLVPFALFARGMAHGKSAV